MDTKIKKNVDHRLSIVLGHLEKVREMIATDRYCIDILQQSLAVQSALKRIDEILLKNHLETCVTSAVKSGKKQKTIDEVIEVFKKGRL